jgi:PAS domain S-box-containing protein
MASIASIHAVSAPSARSLIMGSGQMADMVRAYDWAATPAGDLACWSREHLVMANVVLASRTSAALYWGPELIVLYNERYRAVTGPRHPKALGQSYRDIWPEAWDVVGPQFKAAYEDGETVYQENFLIPLDVDGVMEDRYWTYSLVPVYEYGRIAGVFSSAMETTDSYLAARRLRESEARAQRVLQSIGDAVIVTDAEKRVTRMNAVAEELTGWPARVALGRPLKEIFRIISEASEQQIESPADKVERLGTVSDVPDHTLLIASDGTRRSIEDSSAPIINQAGDLDGIVLVFRDISEKRLAEQEREQMQLDLRARYFQLRAVYETSSIALGMIDPVNFCFLRANQKLAEILNQSIEEVVGAHVFDIAPNVKGLREALMTAASGTPVVGAVIEGELANSPDVHRYWQVEYVPVFSDDGHVQMIASSSIEITAERQMQAALLQTEKLAAVGRLASSMAHEINNPLEAVTNLLYLARTSQDLAEVQGYLTTAEQELQRVALITNQTLRFHRQSTNPTPARCHELIASTLSVFQCRLRNSQVAVEQRNRPCRPVNCFDGEIRQVLNNLVGNGIDAMHATGGRLLIRCREATQWSTGREGIVMTVADTGAGMSPAVQDKIFEPFFTTKGIGGTGLGLWVSHEIIERHHGSLRLRSSQNPGRAGTTFRLFLPFEADIR